jgi:hypothetical protein
MKRPCCGFISASDQQCLRSEHLSEFALKNYERKNSGGARPVCTWHGLANEAEQKTETSNKPNCGAGSPAVTATCAGGPCSRFTPAEDFSFAACRTARLLLADSSISARMACKSSVAEITGNSRTTAHPSASEHCRAVTRCAARAPAPRRHNQQAGSTSSIHATLSSSSIKKVRFFQKLP